MDTVRNGLLASFIIFTPIADSAVGQENVASFYRGKTVRIVVGVAVGSGYDINARVFARHFAGRIPGHPTVIVQNQPGAGSLTMTNALYNTGPFDGTVIGASFSGVPTTPLLEASSARFDPVKLNWLGSTNRETNITYFWHTASLRRLGDLFTTEVVVGAQFPGSGQYDFPILLNRLVGTKFKVITGYESTAKVHLAMERGEVLGIGASTWSSLKALNSNWLQEKKVRIIAQWGLKRHSDFADLPMVLDLAKTQADRQALQLVLSRQEFGRPFFLPPNVAPDRTDALRRAFDATMKDPAYRAEAEKLKLDVDPLSGEHVATLVEQVSKTPPEVVDRVRAALEKK